MKGEARVGTCEGVRLVVPVKEGALVVVLGLGSLTIRVVAYNETEGNEYEPEWYDQRI